MDIYGALAEDLYRAEVPSPVSEHVGRIIIEQYAIAADMAEERWDAGEVHDTLAVFRRAEIETALLSLRGIFPGTVSVESVPNASANAYHREIYSGKVAITQSKVESSKGPIREARFRETLAVRSQISFDWFGDEQKPRADARLWACYVHMPSMRLDRPEFVRVAFPLPDGSWEHSLSLDDLVPNLRGYADSEELLKLREELRSRRRRAG